MSLRGTNGLRLVIAACCAFALVPAAKAFDIDAIHRHITEARVELDANPASFDANVRLGFGYLAMEELEPAEEAFRAASESRPRNGSGRYWLGRAQFARGRYDAAVESFQRVIALLPDWGEARAQIGRCYHKLHRLAEADAAFRMAIALMAVRATHPAEIITPPLFGDDNHDWYERVAALSVVETRYHLALVLLEEGKLDDAARECELALSTNRGAELLSLAGMIAVRRGRIADAEPLLDEAIRTKPTYAPTYYQLGALLSKTTRKAEAEKAFAQWNELNETQKRFEREEAALLRNPDKAPSLVNIGSLYLNSGALADALAAYRKALWFDPNAVEAHSGLGHVYALQGDFGAALKAQHRALELAPESAEVLAGVGFIRLRQAIASQQPNDFAAAVAAYRDAVRIKPDFYEAWTRIGEANAKLGGYTEAASAYETALSLVENAVSDPLARSRAVGVTNQSLGDALLLQGKHDAAKLCYERAIAADATLAESHYNLGYLEYRAGNLDAAEARYRTVIALDPNMPEPRHLLGLIYDDSERLADAEREYREALRLRADSAPTLERLAHLLGQQEGRLNEAIELATRATELQPRSATNWNTLSWIRYRRGEIAEAERAIRQAVELDPVNSLYQEGLRVLERMRAQNEVQTNAPR